MITPKEIDRLTKKLSLEQDITKKEASNIKKIFSEKTLGTVLNPRSHCCNLSLLGSLERWFYTVKKAINDGRKGNFLNTIFLRLGSVYISRVYSSPLEDILRNCLAEPALDNIDKAKEVYISKECAEKIFKKNMVKLKENAIKAFDFRSFLWHTYGFTFSFYGEAKKMGLHPFIESYAPVNFEGNSMIFAAYYDKMYSDEDYNYLVNKAELKRLFIGKSMYQYKINSIVIVAAEDKENCFLYVPKKDLSLMESWLKIPIEEVVSKILSSPKMEAVKTNGLLNILNSKNNNIAYGIPQEVATIGAQVMMKLTAIKNDKERVRSESIDEDLLEMIK